MLLREIKDPNKKNEENVLDLWIGILRAHSPQIDLKTEHISQSKSNRSFYRNQLVNFKI